MGADDDSACAAHAWALTEIHLTVERGAEQAEACQHCGAVRYVPDTARRNRPALPELRD